MFYIRQRPTLVKVVGLAYIGVRAAFSWLILGLLLFALGMVAHLVFGAVAWLVQMFIAGYTLL